MDFELQFVFDKIYIGIKGKLINKTCNSLFKTVILFPVDYFAPLDWAKSFPGSKSREDFKEN